MNISLVLLYGLYMWKLVIQVKADSAHQIENTRPSEQREICSVKREIRNIDIYTVCIKTSAKSKYSFPR